MGYPLHASKIIWGDTINIFRRVAAVCAAFFAILFVGSTPAHADVSGYALINPTSSGPNFCATPQGNSTANGTVITLWTCTSSDLQVFRWRGDALVHSVSGKCLTPRGNSLENGTVLTLWTCTGSYVQDFNQIHTSPRTIRPKYASETCLTNYGGQQANGTWVTLWKCASGVPTEQRWSWG
ncbi:ricin-type beta-trefoil lectin domain protein [Streptomyces flavidovirens]|uniref:RICIN domain-containing protein n=1 Tax=Streptomyces flavidovirens TaxID=67298 RepID=UPI0033A19871